MTFNEGQVAVAEEAPSCASCAIGVGPDFFEKESYPVGDYELCRVCFQRLIKYGRTVVLPYLSYTGVFLFPDGHTETLSYKEKNLIDPEDIDGEKA